jgi:cytoplasmic iron level regulating protein YaaA (DUF328/UPF0246 family)
MQMAGFHECGNPAFALMGYRISFVKISAMITVISPAKSVDFETASTTRHSSEPLFTDSSQKLIHKLRTISQKRLMKLMDISENLAELNVNRYNHWEPGIGIAGSKQAILAFDGDVYQGMEAKNFEESDFEFAQDHLRILSGLYGVLRPMDRIQPHRLEMGTKLPVGRTKNLYEFWGNKITDHINEAVSASGSEWLLNLASQEYFGSVKIAHLKANLVTPVFLDRKPDGYKVVSFWAKLARGKMTAWVIANRLNSPETLKSAEIWGYRYNPTLSTEQEWAFTREKPLTR